jgi:hypothetical protein
MLARARSRTAARVVAGLLAVALAGALPAAGARAEVEAHRCQCHHGPGEQCSCTTCRREARAARRAELDRLPPCHRAAALAEQERDERAPPSGPAILGCCGFPGQHVAAPGPGQPFVPPGELALPHPMEAGPTPVPVVDGPGLDRAPPTPPPRR